MYDPLHDEPEEGTEPSTAYVNQDPDLPPVPEEQGLVEIPEDFVLTPPAQ